MDESENGLVVEVNVQHDADFIDAEAIKTAVQLIASDYNIFGGSVSIAVVDDADMHRLNLQFLQHDYTTDCLSFIYEESDSAVVGELILCADYAQREAKNYDWHPASELLLYAIHGMLHLMGMEDTTDDSRQAMRDEERDVLSRLGIAGADRHGKLDNSHTSDE